MIKKFLWYILFHGKTPYEISVEINANFLDKKFQFFCQHKIPDNQKFFDNTRRHITPLF